MDLERMGDEWHSQLQTEFIANTARNIRIRVQAIERIADRLLQEAIHEPPHCEHFVIQNNVYGEIMKKLKPEISEKSKVQVKECRIKKDNLDDYRTTARNRLNRNKPKFLGNLVFADIIFDKLYTHIVQQCRARHLDDIQIISLFIDILTEIFNAKVNFTQTKPQPVIPYKCLVDGNALKSACINLLKYYSIEIPAVTPSDGQKKAKQSEKAKKEYDKIVQTIKCELKQPHVLSSRPLPFQVFVDEHHNVQTNVESNEIYDAMNEPQLLPSDTTNNNAQYLRRPPLDSFPSGNSYSDESLQIPFSSGSSSNTSVSSMNNDNLPPMIQFNHSMNPMHEIGDLPPMMRVLIHRVHLGILIYLQSRY